MKLTGVPPSNDAEKLIKKVTGDRMEVTLEWLEKQVCHALYSEELRLTRYTADIGLCGRESFHDEANLVISKITPGFAHIFEV